MARKSWWADALPKQLAIMVNTLGKIAGHQVALGLSNGQVTRIQELCNIYITVNNWIEMSRETAESLTAWRQDYYYRPGGGTPLDPPDFIAFAPPLNGAAGAVDEFKEMRDMIVNMPDFPVTIGEDLMWLGEEITPVPPATVVPTVNVTPAAHDYEASVVVSNRGEARMWEVWTLNSGASTWVKVGTFEGKSSDVTFTPPTPGQPYMFQLEIRLVKDNENYGQPSAAVTVTVTP